MKRSILSLLAVLLRLAACGGDDTRRTAWTPVAEDALDAAQKTQRAAAFRAKDAMFEELSGALMGAIQARGPAAAIDERRGEAPAIATRVAGQEGVRIGRTSFRLRNAENTPPAWARALVAGKRSDNAYLAATDGSLGVLLPIRLQAACLTCHGDAAAVAADVRAEIERWYPDDAAMGFAQGDLRGYFWVEVPAQAE